MIYFLPIGDFGLNIRGHLDSISYMHHFIEKLQCFTIDRTFCTLPLEFPHLLPVNNIIVMTFEVNIVYSPFVEDSFHLKYKRAVHARLVFYRLQLSSYII